MSLAPPSALEFCTHPIEGDLPFKAWAALSLEIDGQPESNEKLLNLAGFLVRQALADQHRQRVRRTEDVEALLYGLKAHVQLRSGGCFNFVESHTDEKPSAHQVTPALTIGNLLVLANEPGCEGIEELHARLQPENAQANALIKLQQSDKEPTHLACALLPSMTLTLTPPLADSYTLEYPSRLESYLQAFQQNELAGLPQERCDILLGEQTLDETQPAYPLAYEFMSLILRLLQQRALASGQSDLAARQEQWQHIRLVLGGEVTHTSNYMLNPKTYAPIFKQATRSLAMAGTQDILSPDHPHLEALEQIWDTLAPEEVRQKWESVRSSQDVADRSLMISLEVPLRLEVLTVDSDGHSQVLECHEDKTLFDRDPTLELEQVEPSVQNEPNAPTEHAPVQVEHTATVAAAEEHDDPSAPAGPSAARTEPTPMTAAEVQYASSGPSGMRSLVIAAILIAAAIMSVTIRG